jgi:hypothetical protein
MSTSSNVTLARLGRAAKTLPGMLRHGLRRSFDRLRYSLYSGVVRNPPSRHRFETSADQLTPAQAQVVHELATRGIAFVPFEELGANTEQWSQLQAMVAAFAGSDKVRTRIEQFVEESRTRHLQGDDYIIKLYPEGPTLPLDHPLLQLGLGGPLLRIVNAYLRMWSKLIYTDAWHTIPVSTEERIGSQGWHRDPEDGRMIKVYLYFADVDQRAGPMEYVVGSARGGRYENLWPWQAQATQAHRYPKAGELEARVPAADRVSCVGSAGTCIFCDTSGLHRGGISTGSPRILATWTFVTPAAISVTCRRRFHLTEGADVDALAPEARFALAAKEI